jgi:hypothetical protein
MGNTTGYLPAGPSQTSTDLHRNTSPRLMAGSSASRAYTSNMTSSTLSPNLRTSADIEGSAGLTLHGLPTSQRNPAGQGMTQWPTTHHQMSQYGASLTTGGRGSWDYGTFLDTSSASAAGIPSAAQSMHMQRSEVTPDVSQMPADDPYQQYGPRTTRV